MFEKIWSMCNAKNNSHNNFLLQRPFLLNPRSDAITRISLPAAGDNCTVISFVIACMCSNRSADKETPLESSHKTNNRSGTQAEWHRLKVGAGSEMSGLSVWQHIERWEIGVSVLLLEECAPVCVRVCVRARFLTPGQFHTVLGHKYPLCWEWLAVGIF